MQKSLIRKFTALLRSAKLWSDMTFRKWWYDMTCKSDVMWWVMTRMRWCDKTWHLWSDMIRYVPCDAGFLMWYDTYVVMRLNDLIWCDLICAFWWLIIFCDYM